jgi:hypothetical protein
VVSDLCKYWGIEGGCDSFGLKFESTDEYVTEASKKNIKVKNVSKLFLSFLLKRPNKPKCLCEATLTRLAKCYH